MITENAKKAKIFQRRGVLPPGCVDTVCDIHYFAEMAEKLGKNIPAYGMACFN